MNGHSTCSALPAIIVLIPLAGSFLVCLLGRKSEPLRNLLSALTAGATLTGSAVLVSLVGRAGHVGCSVPLLLGEITFNVDSFGVLFALFTSFVWFASTLYSLDYLSHDKKPHRYQVSSLAALGANMGVVMAGDLVTLYLFFEGLGIIAYLLVVHTETEEAKKAAAKYLWMTVAGGFVLLAGIFLAYGLGARGDIGPFGQAERMGVLRWSSAILMILGFGVKAGMLPVHVWLPDAHPVAPSPASALLSGVMIKAGAYGIFRVVTSLFRPPISERIAQELWHFTGLLGLIVLWIGMVTMFVGVVLALLQENSKRMLAYHSISQMGFILAGIGAAGYLGGHGAMGLTGGIYHVVNHALFKACLFLGVGAVFFRTGELNMYKLGGLWRKMPVTFLFTLTAALGITGVPLFNGFVSKCIIHHALVESYHLHGLPSLRAAEMIYIVTCGGTACSFMKLIIFVFLGKPKRDYAGMTEAPPLMLAGMGVLTVPIAVIGLYPHLLMDRFFVPGLHALGLHAGIMEHYAAFSGENMLSVIYAFTIGGVIFMAGTRFGLFHLHIPAKITIDYWYVAGFEGAVNLCRTMGRRYESWLGAVSRMLASSRTFSAAFAGRLKSDWNRMAITLQTGAPGLKDQQFIETAYHLLDGERQEEIRYAVDAARERLLKRPGMHVNELQRMVDSVHEIASYMGARLLNERMGVVGDLVHSGQAALLRGAFVRILPELEKLREPLTETAVRLAEARIRGGNVVREINRSLDRLLGEEDFAFRLRQLPPREMPAPLPGDSGVTGRVRPLPVGLHYLVPYRESLFAVLEKLRAWIMDMTRVTIVFLMHERVPWMIEEHIKRENIIATRRAIRVYGRDLSFNVAVLAVVFLLFFAAVFMG